MMMRFGTSDDVENIFRKVMIDSIKIVIILEFLVNTYTFSLPIELITMPIIALIAMIDVIASFDEKYSAILKLTRGVQVVVGFIILSIAVSRAISDFQNLQSLDTVRSITLAPLLSLLFSPFVYVMVLISKYELVFVRLKLGKEKEKKLKRYAQRRILMHTGFSLRKVQHLLRNYAVDLMHIQTEADVDRLLRRSMDS
jgi:hypothetical protein